jgi:hypothetical protein
MPAHPDHLDLRLARQWLALLLIFDLDHRQHLAARRQLFQAPPIAGMAVSSPISR